MHAVIDLGELATAIANDDAAAERASFARGRVVSTTIGCLGRLAGSLNDSASRALLIGDAGGRQGREASRDPNRSGGGSEHNP